MVCRTLYLADRRRKGVLHQVLCPVSDASTDCSLLACRLFPVRFPDCSLIVYQSFADCSLIVSCFCIDCSLLCSALFSIFTSFFWHHDSLLTMFSLVFGAGGVDTGERSTASILCLRQIHFGKRKRTRPSDRSYRVLDLIAYFTLLASFWKPLVLFFIERVQPLHLVNIEPPAFLYGLSKAETLRYLSWYSIPNCLFVAASAWPPPGRSLVHPSRGWRTW
jgi:hypothetical protein